MADELKLTPEDLDALKGVHAQLLEQGHPKADKVRDFLLSQGVSVSPVKGSVLAGARAQVARPTTTATPETKTWLGKLLPGGESPEDISYNNPAGQDPSFRERISQTVPGVGRAVEAIPGVVKAVTSPPANLPEAAVAVVGGPMMGLLNKRVVVDPAMAAGKRALETARSGDIPTALLHVLGMTPLVGPMIESGFNAASAGDTRGALGELAGNMLLAGVGGTGEVGETRPAAAVEAGVANRIKSGMETTNAKAIQKITSQVLGKTSTNPRFETDLRVAVPHLLDELGDTARAGKATLQHGADAAAAIENKHQALFDQKFLDAPDAQYGTFGDAPVDKSDLQAAIDAAKTDPFLMADPATKRAIAGVQQIINGIKTVRDARGFHKFMNQVAGPLYERAPGTAIDLGAQSKISFMQGLRKAAAQTVYDHVGPEAQAILQREGALSNVRAELADAAVRGGVRPAPKLEGPSLPVGEKILPREETAPNAVPTAPEAAEMIFGHSFLRGYGALRYGLRQLGKTLSPSADATFGRALGSFVGVPSAADVFAHGAAKGAEFAAAKKAFSPLDLSSREVTASQPKGGPRVAEPALPVGTEGEYGGVEEAAGARAIPSGKSAIRPTAPLEAPVESGVVGGRIPTPIEQAIRGRETEPVSAAVVGERGPIEEGKRGIEPTLGAEGERGVVDYSLSRRHDWQRRLENTLMQQAVTRTVQDLFKKGEQLGTRALPARAATSPIPMGETLGGPGNAVPANVVPEVIRRSIAASVGRGTIGRPPRE